LNRERKVESLGKKIKAAAAEAASSSQFHYSLFYLFVLS
jgi:hypothetical protein